MTKFYSVFDRVSSAFMIPFPSHNDGTAIRSVSAALEDPKSQISRSRGDFDLFFVADFDDVTGVYATSTVKGGFLDRSAERPRLVMSINDIAAAAGSSSSEVSNG